MRCSSHRTIGTVVIRGF